MRDTNGPSSAVFAWRIGLYALWYKREQLLYQEQSACTLQSSVWPVWQSLCGLLHRQGAIFAFPGVSPKRPFPTSGASCCFIPIRQQLQRGIGLWAKPGIAMCQNGDSEDGSGWDASGCAVAFPVRCYQSCAESPVLQGGDVERGHRRCPCGLGIHQAWLKSQYATLASLQI